MRGKPPSRPASLGPRPRRTSRSWNWKNPSPTRNPGTQAYPVRFAELREERERLEAQLRALAKTTPTAADTSLLERLPLAREVLPRPSPRAKARLFQAFDVPILQNKPGRQATVNAEITQNTQNTLRGHPGILNPGQDGYHDTSTTDPPPPLVLRFNGCDTLPERVGRLPHSWVSHLARAAGYAAFVGIAGYATEYPAGHLAARGCNSRLLRVSAHESVIVGIYRPGSGVVDNYRPGGPG